MKLFISYAHEDNAQAKQIVEILQDGGYEPWFDHRLLPGQDWQEKLLAAITTSDAFVYILSPKSVASEWCQWEFVQAAQLNKPVMPILLKECEIPEGLIKIQFANFTGKIAIKSNTSAVAKLMGGLTKLMEYKVPQNQIPEMLHKPTGIPSQAEPSVITSTDLVARNLRPPDVSHILPPPFEWCEIPAGMVEFENGARYSIGTDFLIAKYPITNAQYQVFVDASDGYERIRNWSDSIDAEKWRQTNPTPKQPAFLGDNLPRTNITWYEALAFCRWLSNRLGHKIRLPKEQEWQRAAQGDDMRKYPWGNQFNFSLCNIKSSVLTPVTQYLNGASPYGVMDMAGNICEWCLTKWSAQGSTDIRLDGTEERSLRGYPCYGDEFENVRVTYQVHYPPDYVNNANGFRVATDYQTQ